MNVNTVNYYYIKKGHKKPLGICNLFIAKRVTTG